MMKSPSLFLSLTVAAVMLSTVATAKSPKASALNDAPRAITPPPKEWAMFPDEPPPAPPAQAPQPPNAAGQPPQAAHPQTGATAAAPTGVVSAPVAAAPKRDLPILWIALTGLLSFGALFACGGLILKSETLTSEPKQSMKMVAGVPIVSDDQEIR